MRKRQPIGMLSRSSGNHGWLLENASACVSCGFRLRNASNARNASDCVWMETGLYVAWSKPISDVAWLLYSEFAVGGRGGSDVGDGAWSSWDSDEGARRYAALAGASDAAAHTQVQTPHQDPLRRRQSKVRRDVHFQSSARSVFFHFRHHQAVYYLFIYFSETAEQHQNIKGTHIHCTVY